ncbi:MAG: TetR/AcrR family transcriptional regulator [Bacteroides sp.]|nr:TetR/AcrR family transcriptional regulator [Prevotella sp.]MCM1407541.1 TetR/AcrR family transcriptional regulator [Treponema brennaborense]MCM1469309.1 TetR/AcrR family transcriptional regulator [Bacteroides sp.]
MAIVIEHDKRKHEILDKALDIFMEEGYEDVTFQKIADRCGITRTTLYFYFNNKREIFLWSIKQLTQYLEESLLKIISCKEKTASEKLLEILLYVLDACVENRRLFSVLLSYLLQLRKSGKNPGERVRRRIVRLRHLLSTVIIEGINSGEFKRQNLKDVNEMLYGLQESVIFRLAILDQQDVDEMRSVMKLAVQGLKKNEN